MVNQNASGFYGLRSENAKIRVTVTDRQRHSGAAVELVRAQRRQ
jgi:hypothetical protein